LMGILCQSSILLVPWNDPSLVRLNLNVMQAGNLCHRENTIIPVGRILRYTCIPSEPPLVVDKALSDPSWPSNGEVALKICRSLCYFSYEWLYSYKLNRWTAINWIHSRSWCGAFGFSSFSRHYNKNHW